MNQGVMLQIVYALKTDTDNRPYWKSILAETAPGMYREIFLLKNEGGFWKWPPSRYGVMKAGDTNVLFTNDATTSRDMWCTGEFWVSRKSGPTVIDFLPVAAAMDKAAPANSVGKTRSALDCSEKQSRVQGLRVRRLGGREVQAGGIARGAGVGCVLQRRGTLGVRIKGPGASFTPGRWLGRRSRCQNSRIYLEYYGCEPMRFSCRKLTVSGCQH